MKQLDLIPPEWSVPQEELARPCTEHQRAEFVVGAPASPSAPGHFDEVMLRHHEMRVALHHGGAW